jgi:uncharacterized protein
MFSNLTDLAKSATYYGLAFALILVTALLHPVLGDATIVVAMYTPITAVLLMLLVVTRDGWSKVGWSALGLHRPGLRGWLPAVLIPLVVLGGSYILVWGTGLAGVTEPPEFNEMGRWLLPVFALILIVKHLLLTGALAEEVGWRGYLLPKLVSALGPRWALPLNGLLHGVWHLPIMFLTPLYHADANWLIVVPMFLTGATAIGVVEGHLRLTTNSVWPSAILHAAHNVFWNLFAMATVASPQIAEYVVGESGVLPVLGYTIVVVAIVVIARGRTHRPLQALA